MDYYSSKGFPAGRGKDTTAGFSHLLSNSGGEQKRGRPPPPQWPCLETHRPGRCGDRANDLYIWLTRDVATTQYTQHLGAAVRMRGTGAASPRTQPPRSRNIHQGRARQCSILERPESNVAPYAGGSEYQGVMGRNGIRTDIICVSQNYDSPPLA